MNKSFYLPTIIFTTCAMVAILYWQLIYQPVQAEISRLDAETKQIETIESEIEILQARYGNIEDLAALTEERLFKMQKLLPNEINAEEFIAELYKIAEDKNILINSVQVGEISEKDSTQKQSVKIRLESNYISLLNFIREILDGERLVSFENFSITRADETSILNCELEFLIFAENEKI